MLETGCYLDNHRGHYLTRDMIELAIGHGFIIDPFAQYALDHYEDWSSVENDLHSGMYECLHSLAADALEWLNCGENSGLDRPIKGQNSPPVIPEGTAWEWNDGDFGLYEEEDES